jgi:WD40 repeat protein
MQHVSKKSVFLLAVAVLLTANLSPKVAFSQEERRGIVVHTAGPDTTTYPTGGGTYSNAISDMEMRIPSQWFPMPEQPPRFDLQLTSSPTELERCAYMGGYTLIRQRLAVKAAITDLESNRLIAEHTFEANDPRACEQTENFSSLEAYVNGEFDVDAFEVWLVSTLGPLMTLPGMRFMLSDPEHFQSAQYSPDGQSILALVGREVRIYDASTGQVQRRFTQHTDSVMDAEYSPDGTRVVSASSDGAVWVWDAATGESLLRLDQGSDPTVPYSYAYPDPSFPHTGVAYGADGHTISVVRPEDVDPDVRCWNAETGELLYQKQTQFNWLKFTYSPDGRQIAIIDYGDVIILDAGTGEERFRIPAEETHVIYSHTGRQLLALSIGEVWDTDQGKLVFRLPTHQIASDAAFSPDDQQIITANLYGDLPLQLWDAETGSELPLPDALRDQRIEEGVVYGPDGSIIATLDKFFVEEGGTGYEEVYTARLRDIVTGETLLDLGPRDEYASIVFSPDGERVMMLSDGLITVWNVHPSDN